MDPSLPAVRRFCPMSSRVSRCVRPSFLSNVIACVTLRATFVFVQCHRVCHAACDLRFCLAQRDLKDFPVDVWLVSHARAVEAVRLDSNTGLLSHAGVCAVRPPQPFFAHVAFVTRVLLRHARSMFKWVAWLEVPSRWQLCRATQDSGSVPFCVYLFRV
jgi:hypothetical protein